MLILSRKPGQSVRIDDDTTVSVLSSRGNRVVLGITAPRSKRVARLELLAAEPVKVKKQKIVGAASDSDPEVERTAAA